MSAPTKEQVLAVARSQINETEVPFGSNKCKFSLWYGLIGPWCGMFISWVAYMSGATSIIPRYAYTPSGAAWFKAQGRWSHTPHVGAIVFYQFPGIDRISHTGIVEQVFDDGSWIAIEGNTDELGGRTGGKVMRRHRYSTGAQGGFGNPRYSPSVAPSRNRIAQWQGLLAFGLPGRDGVWGPNTEQRSDWMTHTAYYNQVTQLSGSAQSTIKLIQRIIGTPDDGAYGPASRAAMVRWIKRAQAFLGVPVTGVWDGATSHAYGVFHAASR